MYVNYNYSRLNDTQKEQPTTHACIGCHVTCNYSLGVEILKAKQCITKMFWKLEECKYSYADS